MKSALLLLAFFAQAGSKPPDVPLTDTDPDFPLRVHIIAERWGGDSVHLYRSIQGEMRGGPGYYAPSGSSHGFGTANLLGDTPRGFDFAFDCSAPFEVNSQPGDFYQARWKKQDQRLEILTQPIGSDRGNLCELKVSMKQQAFNLSTVAWQGSSTSSGVHWQEPDVAFTDPDPDYPVHLHVINSYRTIYDSGTQGYGTANLLGPTPQGVDFSYNCSQGFMFSTQPDDFYQGHWVKQDQRLELLLQRLGSDHVDRCQIKVTLRDTPYPASPSTTANEPPLPSPQPAFIKR